MNDESQTAEYIAEYLDGPLEGQSERRALVNGEPEDAFTAFAAIEGVESMFHYLATDSRRVGSELHVRYRFDQPDSDPVEGDPEDDRANDDYLR